MRVEAVNIFRHDSRQGGLMSQITIPCMCLILLMLSSRPFFQMDLTERLFDGSFNGERYSW